MCDEVLMPTEHDITFFASENRTVFYNFRITWILLRISYIQ